MWAVLAVLVVLVVVFRSLIQVQEVIVRDHTGRLREASNTGGIYADQIIH